MQPQVMKTVLMHYMMPNVNASSVANASSQPLGASTTSLFQSLLDEQMEQTAASIMQTRTAVAGNRMPTTGYRGFDVVPQQAIWNQGQESTAYPVWQPDLFKHLTQLPVANTDHVVPAISATSSKPIQHISGSGKEQIDNLVMSAARLYDVDPALIHAVIKTESNYNENTISHAGAKGLMQLMDGTARYVGVSNSFDPQQNIEGGTKYLAMMIKKYDGHIPVALAAYNAGPGRVDRLGIATEQQLKDKLHLLPQETQRYITKVLGTW
ncbi:lytic transglycosylase domain-containing protein [Paenibacillus yanchengensis]|uniref:Lytic transglycosylase domain-containing protein n=1 Tax=Paenibacillus yanchengensis TaxID=2035833 RepID=A0ABW4YL92_9BACL